MADLAEPSLLPLNAAHLRELLEQSAAGLSERALAEAIAVGPVAAGDVAAVLIDVALGTASDGAAAIRAVWLARELLLEGAVPALIRCVEEADDAHPLRAAAVAALAAMGPAATGSLIAAFEAASDLVARSRIAEALARVDADDDRVRAALVRTLREDPEIGARLLAERGEWRTLPELVRTFDRLSREPIADCVLCEGMQLSAIDSAVRALGGALSLAQLETLSDVHDRGKPLWTRVPGGLDARAVPPTPRTRAERPGRNDPCPCGSGKKYKRCHLDRDLRNATH